MPEIEPVAQLSPISSKDAVARGPKLGGLCRTPTSIGCPPCVRMEDRT
jgi:hypothetical protein